ncbi:putative SWEET sugar transporter [Helianthus annuus]|nr:putative SWEET sugar transporter [Helianthus annuus]
MNASRALHYFIEHITVVFFFFFVLQTTSECKLGPSLFYRTVVFCSNFKQHQFFFNFFLLILSSSSVQSLNMNNLYFYVGIIGNIISVMMFLSPVKTFLRIVKKGSTEEFESLPYICTLLNSSLWTYYGITKPDSYLVATVNGFGVVVEIVYISMFLIYAPPRTRAKTAKIAGIVDVVVFAVAVFVTQFAMEGEMRINVIGFMGAALNVVMYASPLSAMRLVWTTKSVEYMPFLLSFFLFLNGGVWSLYAFLVQDWFLGVPNGSGFVLGFAQLALYSIYRKSNVTSDGLDYGSQHRHLLSPSTSDHTHPV